MSEVWNNYKHMKIVKNPLSRLQNILGLEEEWPEKGQQMIFVPPFHLMKTILVADDLRHVIDTPVNALRLI